MDWLTYKWIDETLEAAEKAWTESPYRLLELNYVMGHEEWMNPKKREVFVMNHIARAAVRKVVEWAEKNNHGAAFYGLGGFVEEGDVLILALDWQALKQEVGL